MDLLRRIEPTSSTTSHPAQKVRSTIYLGAEPYLSPPLSESARVYGHFPSMRVVDTLTDDDGGGVLDVIHIGPVDTHDRLTAIDAVVWRGVMTDAEESQVELFRREPDSESINSRTWSVAAVLGAGDSVSEGPRFIDESDLGIPGFTESSSSTESKEMPETPTQARLPFDLVTREHYLTNGQNIPIAGLSNDDKAALVSIVDRISDLRKAIDTETEKDERKNMEHELSDLKNWVYYEAAVCDNLDLRIAYQRVATLFASHPGKDDSAQVMAQITSGEAVENSFQDSSTQADLACSCKKILSQPCSLCHRQGSSEDLHAEHFQLVVRRAIRKLTAAWEHWVPRSAESEITNLMVKEIERLKDKFSEKKRSYTIAPLDMGLDTWKIVVEGPEHTPYENGIFELELEIGLDWQRIKPEGKLVKSVFDVEGQGMRILTKIFHPDITCEGRARNLEAVYALVGFDLDLIAKTFINMLSFPERVPKYLAARRGVADMAKNQPNSFATMAREWTRRYATSATSFHARND